MSLEDCAELRVHLRPLPEEPLMDDVADICRGEVHAKLGRESVFGPDEEGLIGLFVDLLLPECQEPGLAFEPRAQGGRERPEAIDAVLVREHVLRDFVDDEEERRAGLTELEHIADGGHRVFGRLALGAGAGAAHEPAHRVGVSVWIKLREHEREVVLGELLVFPLRPGTAEYFGGGFLE